MRKLLSISLFLLLNVAAIAQAPQKVNYQGVARDISGNALIIQSVGLRLTIHSTTTTGPIVYQETQNPTTNQFGLFNIQLGTGTVVQGVFSSIPWGTNVYFIQVEMDETGGNNYLQMGTSQLISVPYALYAEEAGSGPTGPTGPQGPPGLGTVIEKITASGSVTVTGLASGWHATPYQAVNDTLQLNVTVSGPTDTYLVFVTQHMRTGFFATVKAGSRLRIITAPNTTVQSINLDGQDYPNTSQTDFGASGVAVVSGLAAGTFIFRVENYFSAAGDRIFNDQRQLLIYRVQ